MTERQKKEQEIINLKAELSSSASRCGDWAIIKCYEARLANKPDPYDVDAIVARRQEIRDRINEIEAELAAMPADDQQ